MLWGGHAGSLAGLLAGTALMGLLLTRAFGAGGVRLQVIAALFLLNAAGYFSGGWIHDAWRADPSAPLGMALSAAARSKLAMAMWGLCYGLGFGAGLGYAFHVCQTKARELMNP